MVKSSCVFIEISRVREENTTMHLPERMSFRISKIYSLGQMKGFKFSIQHFNVYSFFDQNAIAEALNELRLQGRIQGGVVI